MGDGPPGAAEYTVHYRDGGHEVVPADSLAVDGPWARFVRGGAEVMAIPQEVVLRIERTGAPPSSVSPPPFWARGTGACVMGIVGVLAVALGAADTFGSRSSTSRLFGVVFVALGVAALVGADGLLGRGRKGGAFRAERALVGALALFILGAVLTLVQVSAKARPWLFGLWLLVLSLGLAGVVVAMRAGGKPRVPKPFRSLLTVGVIIGLFQFWYTNEYVPTNKEPGLSVKVDLAKAKDAMPSDDGVPVSAVVTVRNVSKSKVRFIGGRDYFAVTDEDGKPTDSPDEELHGGEGRWLEPDQETVASRVFFLSTAARTFRMNVAIHVGKGSRFTLGSRVACTVEGKDFCKGAIGVWRVVEPSSLHRLTRGPRYLRQDSEGEGKSFRTCFTSGIAKKCDLTLNGTYGNANVGAYAKIAL